MATISVEITTPIPCPADSVGASLELLKVVREGLSRSPKSLPPWLFYDEAGSLLFEEITGLPEYYITRIERGIFARDAAEMIALAAGDAQLQLVELGAGSADKTRLLLAAATDFQGQVCYQPVDVSESALEAARQRLEREHPEVRVEPQVADYTRHLSLPACPNGEKRLVLYIGSSIGNFLPEDALELLCELRAALGPGDSLLLGVDLAPQPAEKAPGGGTVRGYDSAVYENNPLEGGTVTGHDSAVYEKNPLEGGTVTGYDSAVYEKNPLEGGTVTGHDFSRADKANQITAGFSPCHLNSDNSAPISSFSPASPTPGRKTEQALLAAYDDPHGVTARFNKNMLSRLNRELGADFDLEAFRHRIRWNAAHSRIEMHLESLRTQTVRIAALDLEVRFVEGETIHTENSYKYRTADIEALLATAGFVNPQRWRDENGWFAVYLATAFGGSPSDTMRRPVSLG